MKPRENLSLDRYEWAGKKIKEICAGRHEEITIFDIGSRDNVLKGYLPENGILYRGFDLNPITDTAEKWDISGPFPYHYSKPQVVTLLEVLEHLNNPGTCLKNIADVMATGGYLILTTPNPGWSASRLSLLSNGYLTCFTQSDLDLNHHVFTPWPHIVEKFLTDSGFQIIEYVTLDGKTKVFDKTLFGGNVVARVISRSFKKIIERKDPSSCGMSYGLLIKKTS